MANPGSGPLALPTVHFRTLDPTEPFATPPTLTNDILIPYGYNHNDQQCTGYSQATEQGDGGRYLRWLQPMETELAKQVEYDMDDQDQIWLDSVNADRKKDGHPAVTYELFEIIMDKIEKEWFDLTKNIPKKSNAVPTEDAKCGICDDGECENSNAIVFCDGCNLAVHQDCYGVPYIPEGQWLCRKCTVCPEKPVTCVLCPNPYGAFKQTTTGQWAHLLCAIWIPDTGVSNTVYMEPVDGVEGISKSRWKLVCYLCKNRVGACIQCAKSNCYTAFHVTCAREYGLELKMRQGGGPAGELRAFCDKHGERPAPSVLIRALTQAKARGGSAAQFLKLTKKKTFKTARGYKSSSAPANGPPVVPAAIAERVVAYVGKFKMGGKKEVVNLVCRYWSLKREARRGAPLLKRIHLEPWTASATTLQHSEADKAHKLELIRLLRNDLEKVRMLTEQVRKREKKKLDRAIMVKEVVERFVWPRERRMGEVLGELKTLDKPLYFAQPVDRVAVPDYYDIIKHPMDWSAMRDKLDRHEYTSCGDFVGDVQLVINNARRYNKPYTPVHKAAIRLLELSTPFLEELEALDQPQSIPSLLSKDLAQVFTAEVVEELWRFGYDTEDPDGSKARKQREEEDKRVREEEERMVREKKEEEERRVKEEEERVVREEKEQKEREDREEKARKKVEEAAAAAAAKKKRGKKEAASTAGQKKDVKGKGKAVEPVEEASEDNDAAMDVDEAPSAAPTSAAKKAATASSKGRKRSAEFAGLDSPAPTPGPAARTTRSGATSTPASAPPSASTAAAKKTRSGVASTPAESMAKSLRKEEDETEGRKPLSSKAKGKGKGKAKETEPVSESEPEPEPEPAPVKAKKAESKPKKSAAPPGKSVPPSPKIKDIVQLEDVGSKDSFTHFETGWILPSGSRRRSSVLPTPAASTPKPKVAKTKPAAAASTSKPTPPIALTSKQPPSLDQLARSKLASAPVKIDKAPRPSADSPLTEEPDSQLTEEESSELEVAKELTAPTPAPSIAGPSSRRAPRANSAALPLVAEKPASRSAAKKGKAKAVEPVEETKDEDGDTAMKRVSETPQPQPPTPKQAKGKGKDAPISPVKALTDATDRYKTIKEWEERHNELLPSVLVTEQTELDDGYLVWARAPGFPFYPAEVVDPEDPDTPEEILEIRPKKHDALVPVYFFSGSATAKERTSAWLTRDKLRELGENDEFDHLLLHSLAVRWVYSKTKQKSIASSVVQRQLAEVRHAFEEAAERMESAEDEEERLAQEAASSEKGVKAKGQAKGKSKAAAAKKRKGRR
ncbi:hypothetical protein JCM11641_004461 [Rhodosporidiobolus odoratus]